VRASLELPGQPPLPGRALDVSADGMSMLLPHPLPEKLSCRVRFALFVHGAFHKFDIKAQLLGSVFLSDSVRLSLKFNEIEPATRKLLADFVHFHLG
jgi:c-di-GMP-binding flagellar brake protein YcgR